MNTCSKCGMEMTADGMCSGCHMAPEACTCPTGAEMQSTDMPSDQNQSA